MIKIVEFFINKPKVVNLFLFFIVITGLISIILMKKERIQSDAEYGGLYITTVYPGASPRDVELKVTSKLEKELKGIDGISDIESVSMEAFSSISVDLEDKSDFQNVKNNIRKAIEQVNDLPEEIKSRPLITEISEEIRPVYELAIIGEADYRLKRKYALALEKNLMANKYVSKVEKMGYLKREVKIEVNQDKLKEHYVSIGEIMNAIKSRNFRMSAGDLLEKDAEKKYIVESEFKNVKELNNVIIRSGFTGNRVVVSDVAVIKDGFEKPETIVRYNGKNSINMIVYKKSDADMIRMGKSINKIVNDFNLTLPENVNTEIIVDYNEDVISLLSIVFQNAIVGFILVIIVLFLLLNYKVAIWTATGIPVSIFMAFTLFPFFNVNIHYMSLVAIIIVLGMLVDDAIIIAENIYRFHEKGMSGKEAAISGLKEVIWPVITTVLTTILAFLPIAAMTGTMRKIFIHIPIVVTILLVSSLLEGLFFLPSHMAHTKFKKKNKESYKTKIFSMFESTYKASIKFCLKFKFLTILVFILLFAASIYTMTKIDFLFFDEDDSTRCYIEYELQKGNSLEASSESIKKVEKILRDLPESEVKGFVTVIGEDKAWSANFGELIVQGNYLANTIVYLTPQNKRDRNARQIINEIKGKIKNINDFVNIEADLVDEGPPVGRAVDVAFISNDDNARKKIAEDLEKYLKTQEGVFNIKDNVEIGKKQIEINFNYNQLSRNGLDPYSVADTIRAAFNGIVVTSIEWEGEEVDFRIILDESSRSYESTVKALTIQKVKSLFVENNKGNLVPIGRFVTLNEKNDILKINHIDGDRSIKIYADVDKEKITSKKINEKIRNIYEKKIMRYPGMQMETGGEDKELSEAFINLFIAVGLAFVGIYFILVILFNSFTQPFLVMLAIPFSFSGVVFSFFIHGMSLSMPAMIGFLGLMGVVVNDSLVMISFLNKSKDKNGYISLESLADAAKFRLRPILLTTVTTAAALFPLAYGFGGYNMFASPMVMAIAWGLIFATLVTLFLIPALYLVLNRIHCFFHKSNKNPV